MSTHIYYNINLAISYSFATGSLSLSTEVIALIKM